MDKREPTYALGSIVEELTHGKPYVFMIMPYKSDVLFFKQISELAREAVGLPCIRADQIPAAGHDLLSKVHLLIERSELVIALISTESKNVFYEVGYAAAIQKPLLLLGKKGHEVPTDLKGRELLEYGDTMEEMETFYKKFQEHLRVRVGSRVSSLRDMLEAETPRPAFIVASPKYPGAESRIRGQVRDTRTFGDNLGILGLLSAFGAIMGEGAGVELVSAQYCSPEVGARPQSLYLVGSGKVNPIAESMLSRLQKEREPNWTFGPPPGKKASGDYGVRLYRTHKSEVVHLESVLDQPPPYDDAVHKEDYGIIVRGPHPDHPDRLVLIMAGAHSLGTGAACLAATRSPLIRQIKEALPSGVDIAAEKRLTFWALVRGRASKEDNLLDVEDVTVVEAGVYD